MLRSSAVALTAASLLLLTACGSSTTSSAGSGSASSAPSAAATTTAAAPGDCVATSTDGSGTIPALTGNPQDTTVEPQIGEGGDNPPTELKMADVVVGTGATAVASSSVVVNYAGVFYCDGTAFDSSWKAGQPVPFSLAKVIPGFTQGISGMAVGGRREMVIPPDLGYGPDDYQTIPGGSTLVFVVDLVGIS